MAPLRGQENRTTLSFMSKCVYKECLQNLLGRFQALCAQRQAGVCLPGRCRVRTRALELLEECNCGRWSRT
eukprot:2497377-Amphidinium_carterae.2